MVNVGQDNTLWGSGERFCGCSLWETNHTERGACAQSKTQSLL